MSEDEMVVTIKFYCEEPPQMKIKYTDKKDLFEQFQKNLKRFDFPTDEIYWYDWENVHTRMRTPEDVYISVKDNCFAKMFARDPRNRETFSTFSSDDEDEEEERKEKQNGGNNPESDPRRGSRHHADYSYYPESWNYVDPRYRWIPFPFDPRAYGMGGYRPQEEKPHCFHCKDRYEQAERP
ncbi:hypothetical protein Aduo_001066 [Ancylostoma duodenale]